MRQAFCLCGEQRKALERRDVTLWDPSHAGEGGNLVHRDHVHRGLFRNAHRNKPDDRVAPAWSPPHCGSDMAGSVATYQPFHGRTGYRGPSRRTDSVINRMVWLGQRCPGIWMARSCTSKGAPGDGCRKQCSLFPLYVRIFLRAVAWTAAQSRRSRSREKTLRFAVQVG